LFTASTGLSPDGGLQASHTAQGSRSASGSADGTTSRWVMEKAGENAPDPPFWTALKGNQSGPLLICGVSLLASGL